MAAEDLKVGDCVMRTDQNGKRPGIVARVIPARWAGDPPRVYVRWPQAYRKYGGASWVETHSTVKMHRLIKVEEGA